MKETTQRIVQLVSANKIITILAVIAIFSIVLLFAGFTNGNRDNSDDISAQIKQINAGAQRLKDIGLPKSELEKIKGSIQKIGRKNGLSDINFGDVIVRSNFVKTKQFNDFGLAYINFIVDLPEQKQSYQISHEWSNWEQNSYLSGDFSAQSFCIRDKEKIKYKEFDCKDSFANDPKYAIVKNYARFDIRDDTEITFSQDDPTKITVTTHSYSEEEKNRLIHYAEKWIKSLGFSTDGFSIDAREAGGGAPEE